MKTHEYSALSVRRLTALVSASAMVGLIAACSSADDVAPGGIDQADRTIPEQVTEDIEAAWSRVTSQYPEAPRPPTTIERLVSSAEWAPAIAACMNRSGFPDVVASIDGGVESGEIPVGQQEAYTLAFYECYASFPLDPIYYLPLTEDQIERLFDYYTGDLTTCLTELGYQISPPPTFERFAEELDSAAGWNPMNEALASATDYESYLRVFEVCTETPPDFYDG